MTITTEHNVEEKGSDKMIGEEVSDGSTRDKPVVEYEETTHHAAAMGQYATDKYVEHLLLNPSTPKISTDSSSQTRQLPHRLR